MNEMVRGVMIPEPVFCNSGSGFRSGKTRVMIPVLNTDVELGNQPFDDSGSRFGSIKSGIIATLESA